MNPPFIDRTFEDALEVTIHELMHVFGISGYMFQYFIDPSTGTYYSTNVAKIVTTTTIRGLSTNILSSANVLKAVK